MKIDYDTVTSFERKIFEFVQRRLRRIRRSIACPTCGRHYTLHGEYERFSLPRCWNHEQPVQMEVSA